jgi:hypothetical protein
MKLIELKKVKRIARVNLLKNTSGNTPSIETSELISPVTLVKPAKILISSLKTPLRIDQKKVNWLEIMPKGRRSA